ncbi:MAG: TonB-dependent receptor [Cyclobacteriaceae bacterium]
MKNAVWIYIVLFLPFIALAQNQSNLTARITEDFQKTELKEALSLLKNKYGIKTAFGEKIVKGKFINIILNNCSVYDAFSEMLKGTGLDFEMLEIDLFIIKKPKKDHDDTQALFFDLTGSVKDVYTGESLPHAYVWLDTENKSLATNVDGHFSLTGAKLPTALKIMYLGYRDTTVIIDRADANKRLIVQLTPNPQNLKEMVITDLKTNDFEIGEFSENITMNPNLASSIPSTGEVDIFKSIQLLPGINATNELSSGLRVRGGTSNQNLFLFDGFTVYHVDHLFGYFSAFNPNAIKSVRLSKGGYGAEYGGRVSSIIDMAGKDGNKYKAAGILGLNFLSLNSTLEIPLSDQNTTLFFSGRRSYTDFISTPLFDNIFSNFSSSLSSKLDVPITGNGNNHGHSMGGNNHGQSMGGNNNMNQQAIVTESSKIDPVFYYNDFNLKISSNVSIKNRLSLSIYNSKDILNFTESATNNVNDTLKIESKTVGFINWGNTGTSLKFSRLWDNEHFSNVLISYSKYSSTYNDVINGLSIGQKGTTISSSINDQYNSMKDISIKIDHQWQSNSTNLLKMGLSGSLYNTAYTSVADNETLINERQKNKTLSNAYLEYNFNTLPNLNVTIGLRGGYFSPTHKFYIVPRFNAKLNVGNNLKFKAAVGQYNQFLNQVNTKNVLQGSRDFWILADGDNIPVQHATHYLAGFDYQVNDGIEFSADIYSKKFDGLLEYAFSNGGLVTEFQNFNQLFFQGAGKAKGIELLLKKNRRNYQAWIGYTLGEVKYSFSEINDGKSYFADHDRRHELNAYGSLKIKNFEFFATWLYGSGSPYSLATSASFASQDSERFESHVSVISIDEKNNLRLPAYHRLDVGGSYFVDLKNDMRGKVSLSIFNVYDRRNIQDIKISQMMRGFQSGMRMNNPILQVNDIPLLGISPNLSVGISF